LDFISNLLGLIPVPLYLTWMLIINVITAIAYARDKQAARSGARRIPERTLFLLNLAGGVVGAWAIFFLMRHKTRHISFWIVQLACTLLYVFITLAVLT
jgi:uncharacterized membrane protein YsdA (DUF1294 family)